LLDASRGWAQAPRRIPAPPHERPNPGRPPSHFFVRGVGSDGRVWLGVNDRDTSPDLPVDNDVGRNPITVGSVDGSDVRWRAVSVRGAHGQMTTVAVDLSDVESTVRSLI